MRLPMFSVAYMIFIITSYAFTGVSSNHVGKFTGVARQVMDIGYSMSDLYERVRLLSLPHTENIMFSIQSIGFAASAASEELDDLGAGIFACLDKFVAFDLWARKTFEGIEQIEKPISIFSVVVYSPRISTSCRQEVARQYRIAVRQLEEELDQLINQVPKSHRSLKDLEQRLITLGGQIGGDKNELKYKRDQIVAKLWTKVGGNEEQVAAFERSLMILSDVWDNYDGAIRKTRDTLGELQTFKYTLHNLRTSVYFDGEFEELERHFSSFRSGVQRIWGAEANGQRNY